MLAKSCIFAEINHVDLRIGIRGLGMMNPPPLRAMYSFRSEEKIKIHILQKDGEEKRPAEGNGISNRSALFVKCGLSISTGT
jgi:hypothetical protein